MDIRCGGIFFDDIVYLYAYSVCVAIEAKGERDGGDESVVERGAS